MTILAALIEYDVDGVTKHLGVTDGAYTDTTGVTLEDGLWYPVLSSDVNWSEQARHPYQEQGGELAVGNLVLANDGTLDFLMDADIVGQKVTLKRGDPDETFANMEQVFIARIAGRRFQGHQILIELDNWLAKLSGPVFTETFDSDTPNPQLVGKQIPYVLGKVTQAPVLEYDPNNLTYYTAANTSLIGEVTEGGNPTQKWYLNAQPTFDLKGSPTLPITATFEGPSDTAWTTIIDDDLSTWDSGTDTALTSPYTQHGNHPTGWELIVGDSDGNVFVGQSGGLNVNAGLAAVTTDSTTNDVTTADAESVSVGSSVVRWTAASSAVISDSGSASISTTGDKTDGIEVSITNFESATTYLRTDHSITSGSIAIDYLEVLKNDNFIYRETLNYPLPPGGVFGVGFSGLWGEVLPSALSNSCQLRLKLRDDIEGGFDLGFFFLYGSYAESPSVHLRRNLGLVPGRSYSVQIEGISDDPASFMWGAYESSGVDVVVGWPEHEEYAEYISQGGAETVDGGGASFVLNSIITPNVGVFNLSHQPEFGYDGEYKTGTFVINRIKITEQSTGNKSYKSLAPHVIEQVGYTSSEYDQASFNAHADEYGDPELGWLVLKNETADQVLFRLAGSLNGYVWHGLDGKVRSKRLKAPTPVDDPFVIDSTRANPADVVAYDDPAPNLRRSVNALRNWQPLKTDDTAGVTTTWTEEDRAKVTTDWRITRAWEMGTDGKDEFTRRWPNVASREPLSTALRDATTAQLIANEGPDTWIQRPMFYEIPVQVNKGELADVATGETVKAELDYPGLENTWLLVLGRSGTATPGVVNLTLWSADQSPVALLAPYRFDPRITFTRNSAATYFDSSGVLQTAAVDEARLDHDPATGEPKGWLFEESRTNELLDNRDLSTGNWTTSGVTSTQDVTGLDGVANKAWTITDATTGSAGREQQDITVPNDSNSHALVAWFKKNSGDEANGFPALQVVLSGGTNVVHAANIDTRDGSNAAVSGQSDGSHTVEDFGDWWRVEVMVTNNSSGNTTLSYRPYPALTSTFGGAFDANATGTVTYDFGQVELDVTTAASPTETGGSAVTRNADSASITGTDFGALWNDTEGTISVEIEPQSAEDGTILSINDGTSNEMIVLEIASGNYRARIVDGGTATASIAGGAAAAGTATRLTLAYKANDVAFYQDGVQQGTDAGATIPTVTQMEWGTGYHFANVDYYPLRRSNSDLADISTVGRDLILDKV